MGAWVVGLLALAGCANQAGSASSSELVEGEVCEPVLERPVYAVDGSALEAATMTLESSETGVRIHLEAAAGWTMGDFYFALGPSIDSLTWFTVNPEPWMTGWHPSIDLEVSLEEIGAACGSEFKLITFGRARDAAGVARQVSAIGSIEMGGGGWADFYDVCCLPLDIGCTLTQGFWKTHEEAWPLESLTLGSRTYTQDELLAIFGRAPRGDASIILAHQVIAAELNAANGATRSPDLAAAHAWLAANGATLPYGTRQGSTAARTANRLADAIAAYNEGVTGPGHCGD